MKILTLSALLCAMVALSRATALSESKETDGALAEIKQPEKHVMKRLPSCPKGWKKYNCHCFRYIPRAMTWAQAERNCQSMGANLASVHKIQDYHWIQHMIRDQAHGFPVTWIGGSDSEEEDFWFWTDGTPFTFSFWCRGEPSNNHPRRCIQMNYGVDQCWDDALCQEQRPSVCAKKI